MNTVRATHHVGLTVASLEAARRFYVDLLGFDEVFSWNPTDEYIRVLVGYPDVDLHATILRLPGTDVSLELLEYRGITPTVVDHGNGNPGVAHLAFFVDDLDELYAQWTAAGVASVSAPVTPTQGPNQGGRVVYMIDPDGYRIELIQSNRSFADFADGC